MVACVPLLDPYTLEVIPDTMKGAINAATSVPNQSYIQHFAYITCNTTKVYPKKTQ